MHPSGEFIIFSLLMSSAASLAGIHSLFEELAFHLVARQRARRRKVLSRRCISSTTKVKLPQCRLVERIGGQPILRGNRTNCVQTALRPVSLRDRDSAIEGDNRRWIRGHLYTAVVAGFLISALVNAS